MGGTEPAIHAAFVASPAHFANLVDPAFRNIGVGVASAGGLIYVAEVFMQPACAPPTTTTPTVPVITPTPKVGPVVDPVAPTQGPIAEPVAPAPPPAPAARTPAPDPVPMSTPGSAPAPEAQAPAGPAPLEPSPLLESVLQLLHYWDV